MQTSKKKYSVSEARLEQLIKSQLDLQFIEDDYTHDPRNEEKFYLDSKKMPQLRRNVLLNIQLHLVVDEDHATVYSINSLEKLKLVIVGTVACELPKI